MMKGATERTAQTMHSLSIKSDEASGRTREDAVADAKLPTEKKAAERKGHGRTLRHLG